MGKKIMAELGAGTCDTLTKWLSQLLAERIGWAESETTPKEKLLIENQTVDLILRIWRQRYQLPYGVGPFGKLEKAIDALSALEYQKTNPFSRMWGQHREQTPWDTFESAINELHSRVAPLVVLTPLVIEIGNNPLEWEQSNQQFLDEFETRAITLLQNWLALLGDGSGVPSSREDESPETSDQKTKAAFSKIESALLDLNAAFNDLKRKVIEGTREDSS